MPKLEVLLYEKTNGECPVETFIRSLPAKEQAKLLRDIDLLEELGTSIREPLAKPIKGEKNLYELRSIFSNNIQRVFYCLFDGKQAILLHGFTKKSQKTPTKEIDRAKSYRDDYHQRHQS
jgi:phage-related protein